jgi:hypothetical protein
VIASHQWLKSKTALERAEIVGHALAVRAIELEFHIPANWTLPELLDASDAVVTGKPIPRRLGVERMDVASPGNDEMATYALQLIGCSNALELIKTAPNEVVFRIQRRLVQSFNCALTDMVDARLSARVASLIPENLRS